MPSLLFTVILKHADMQLFPQCLRRKKKKSLDYFLMSNARIQTPPECLRHSIFDKGPYFPVAYGQKTTNANPSFRLKVFGIRCSCHQLELTRSTVIKENKNKKDTRVLAHSLCDYNPSHLSGRQSGTTRANLSWSAEIPHTRPLWSLFPGIPLLVETSGTFSQQCISSCPA